MEHTNLSFKFYSMFGFTQDGPESIEKFACLISCSRIDRVYNSFWVETTQMAFELDFYTEFSTN